MAFTPDAQFIIAVIAVLILIMFVYEAIMSIFSSAVTTAGKGADATASLFV
tara:strand:- start:181 stop:333 length:153 start_codon:yes stop_codon:yes gene_type:complete